MSYLHSISVKIEYFMILDNYQQTHRLTKCLLLEMVSHLKVLYLSDDIV